MKKSANKKKGLEMLDQLELNADKELMTSKCATIDLNPFFVHPYKKKSVTAEAVAHISIGMSIF